MADEQPPSVQCEDVAIDEARRMGRGPRMEPTRYDTLRQKIASLSTDAVRIHLGPEITQGASDTVAVRGDGAADRTAHTCPDTSHFNMMVFPSCLLTVIHSCNI